MERISKSLFQKTWDNLNYQSISNRFTDLKLKLKSPQEKYLDFLKKIRKPYSFNNILQNKQQLNKYLIILQIKKNRLKNYNNNNLKI